MRANSHQRTQDATTHRADGMHEEECPTNVADSENIQQLDIRVVRVDTAMAMRQ